MSMQHVENIIIGGGPSGLSMALEFKKREIDYLLLEGSDSPGGQWDRFPVCGKLISLNKKYVPGENFNYRMRYDWHSLSGITESDAEKDPKLLFRNWTDLHWPEAKTYKQYLIYVANKMRLMDQIITNARVRSISRSEGYYVIETEEGRRYSADRLFCATGASEEIIPDIKGLNEETSTLYSEFNLETAKERYENKVVIVIGRGNSAMEIATNLINITAETRVVTRSLPMFAKQTHSSHDLRSHVSEIFDLMQLKSNNSIVSDRIVEVSRIKSGPNEGRLQVQYETSCLHWTPPRWMKRSGIVDEIIICCGFNYTMADIFDTKTVNPKMDEKGKYCLLSESWESVNLPGLYFIGASMRVKDYDAASGFIHGFRCNINALATLVNERYYDKPLQPLYESVIPNENPQEMLLELSEFLVNLVSNDVALFELFGYFSSVITYEEIENENCFQVKVWPPFPSEYNKKRWGRCSRYVEIRFQYGFDQYGDGNLPTHYFTLPSDHFDTSKSAYLHPVFEVYRNSMKVEEFHMQESLISRWDSDDYIDEETNIDQYKNVAYNASACALGLAERRSLLPVKDEYIEKCYPMMTVEEVLEAIEEQPTLALLNESLANLMMGK